MVAPRGACMVALRGGSMHGIRGKGGGCVVCTAGHCAGGTHPTGMHSCVNYSF